ncbi:MAG: hypothetical protein IT377_25040 [Polyangiaceae bacterium]|nr:hypothetical protein [Myxococcales bacterium]MCC6902261.1 hypothetical protein [Polyangiaceae bacterium]
MARKVEAPVPINKRGSPEAIAKRRSARAFNELLDPAGSSRLDGRTEQRRRRLLAELESGKTRGSGRPLKPVDVLSHVTELLELGESVASIRKVCRPRTAPVADARLVETVGRLHRAYGFPKEAYGFLGFTEDVLRRAGVVGPAPKRRRNES